MPAELKNETMRKFFQVTFVKFRKRGSKLNTNVDDVNTVSVHKDDIREADFAMEHSERRMLHQQYLQRTNLVDLLDQKADSGPRDVKQNDNEYQTGTDSNVTDRLGMKRSSSHIFNVELQRAEKNFIDAREACLLEWDLRDRILDELEVL